MLKVVVITLHVLVSALHCQTVQETQFQTSSLTIDLERGSGPHPSPGPRPSPRPSPPRPSPRPRPLPPRPSPHPSPSTRGLNIPWSALSGFILGPILFFSSFTCICYNERRAAIDYRRIKLGQSICQEVDVYSHVNAIDKDQQLVYAHGQTLTNYRIQDPICGVGGDHLIKIVRKVEVLEWRQKHKKNNSEEVYYQLEWSASNSSTQGERFNNPSNWFIQNTTIHNPQVYLGGFHITQDVSNLCHKQINGFKPQTYMIDSILNQTQPNKRMGNIVGDYMYFPPNPMQYDHEGYIPPNCDQFDNIKNIKGYSSDNHQDGTLRVSFQLCPIGPLSLIAQAIFSSTRKPYFYPFNIAWYEGLNSEKEQGQPQNGLCCLLCNITPIQELLLVDEEIRSKEELFKNALNRSFTFTNTVRALAFVVMVLGISLFFSPIVNSLGYIPLVGKFVGGVAMVAIFIGALIVCLPLFLITVSVAWLIYNPKIGAIILTVGIAIFLLIWKAGSEDKTN